MARSWLHPRGRAILVADLAWAHAVTAGTNTICHLPPARTTRTRPEVRQAPAGNTAYSGSSQLSPHAEGGGNAPGTKVNAWTCNSRTDQQRNLNSDGAVTGPRSGPCLDASGASTANGALVQPRTRNGGSSRRRSLG
ncbi:RICIN domain-containing protein [Streptomyces sp. N50]|uniref:RICIN domain-containing protein n=1 Tax=Streptomyces sp. N50 TaxID=3081765 RepID=UPI0029621988|nr:RICIN domain-containing protein [Streptomyces sp. N50]WOX07492.1 RICIN domain-containing protein [Streptomyces sp. N50]